MDLEEDGKLSRRGARKAKITIPGLPPSTWGAYARKRNGGVYLTPKARNWRDDAVEVIKDQFRYAPFSGRISLNIAFYVKSRGGWDIDNRSKVLLDALTEAGVWIDDQQVDVLHTEIFVDGSQEEPITQVKVICYD